MWNFVPLVSVVGRVEFRTLGIGVRTVGRVEFRTLGIGVWTVGRVEFCTFGIGVLGIACLLHGIAYVKCNNIIRVFDW